MGVRGQSIGIGNLNGYLGEKLSGNAEDDIVNVGQSHGCLKVSSDKDDNDGSSIPNRDSRFMSCGKSRDGSDSLDLGEGGSQLT